MRMAALGLALALAAGAAGTASAQQMFRPTPLEASNPRAQKANALAALLAKADFAGATQYVKANAAPGSFAAAEGQAQIDAIKSMFASGGFTIDRVDQGRENDVLVMLSKPGGDPIVFSVDVSKTAPYGILAVRSMKGRFRVTGD